MVIIQKSFEEACEILRDNIEIEEYLMKENHVGFDLKGHRGLIRCPFPDHNDSTASFSYNNKKQVFNCFGCGRGGDIVNLHYHFNKIEDERYSRLKAVRELSRKYKVTIPDLYKEEMDTGRVQKYRPVRTKLNNLTDDFYKEKVRGMERRVKSLRDTKKRIRIYRLVDDMYLGHREAKDVMELIRRELR